MSWGAVYRAAVHLEVGRLFSLPHRPVFLIDGGAKRPEGNPEDDIRRVAEAAERLGKMAKSRGIRAVWHIHWGTLPDVQAVPKRTAGPSGQEGPKARVGMLFR
ncbi:MAG: hypothetical protein DRP95_05655 [Candidatus Latescibacterota bacterium]|nr:MAG: hypothetical protein DRP95_05655 [Candidatus Latescibacterota bacterium]